MPVNKINPNVPSVGSAAAQAQQARPTAPTGANSFASKLAANAPATSQAQSASKSIQAPPTQEEKMEAMKEIMRQQSLMMSQQIMNGGKGSKIDSE